MEDTTGVNQAETPAVESPTTEQTTPETASNEKSTQTVEEVKTVPYERFKEVNENLKAVKTQLSQFESRLPKPEQKPEDVQAEKVKQALNALGYAPRDQLLQEVKADLQREREDMQMAQTLKSLESKFDGKNGIDPKFDRPSVIDFAIKNGISDPESAYRLMTEKVRIDNLIKQAITGSKGTKSEASDGSGSANAGATNDDLKAAAKAGDKNALHTLIKRSIKKT